MTDGETAFQSFWQQLPAGSRGNIAEILIAYIRSPLFVQRRTM
jgi:hypothetical protein